jgi:integrase
MRASEIKGLHWRDVNFLERTLTVRESKTDAGRRVIPLNSEARDTVLELYERAKTIGGDEPQFFVFPACENNRIDPARAQQSWRSAWRALRKKAGLQELRFHDLRHHAITELAESQASDQTVMAIAGHVSREMLEHYSHVRLEAKRRAVEALSQRHLAHSYVTRHDTTGGHGTGGEFVTEL